MSQKTIDDKSILQRRATFIILMKPIKRSLVRGAGFCFLIIVCKSFGSRDTLQSLDTLTIRSSRPITSNIDQKKIEQSIGIVDDLNTILLQKPGVQSIPEAGSMLLVNGEGPFDNLYLVRGIPVFPPSNFAGHTYADRSIISLALPNTISFSASDASGKWSGASGSVIGIDPCILKTTNRLPRPEGAIGAGSFSTDLSLNIPANKARDRYQISYHIPISYALAVKSLNSAGSDDLGYGIPAAAWNIRTLGEQSRKNVRFRQLLWGGVNTYAKDFDEMLRIQQGASGEGGRRFPWGMAIFSADDSLSAKPWKVSFGCSRQHYFEAKQIFTTIPCKAIERNNGALSLQCDVARGASWAMDLGLLTEYLFWQGKAFTRNLDGKQNDTIMNINKKDKNAQVAIGFRTTFSEAQLKVNLTQGFFNSGKAFFMDPCVSLGLPAFSGNIEVSLGITSSPADIRGLPGSQFDQILARTYHAHLRAKRKLSEKVYGSAEVFFKYKDRVFLYEDSPSALFWDVDRKASLMAAGSSCQIEWKAGKRFAFTANASIGRSMVCENGRKSFSDWDIPFANMSSVSVAIIPDKMKLYCIGTYSTGRPYRDVFIADSALDWSARQLRLPRYKCVDLKWEWRQPTDGDFFTEYGAFILIQNVCNWDNVREYQWETFGKKAISLSSMTFAMGMRANFRLLYW